MFWHRLKHPRQACLILGNMVKIRPPPFRFQTVFDVWDFVVSDTRFLAAHDVALGGGNGVGMLGEAGAVLVAKEDAVRKVVHVDGLVVGRWCKDVVDIDGWFFVGVGSGGNRFGVDD